MKLFLLALPLLLSLSLSAQDHAGIEFSEKAFDELLAEAKAADKLIFIDAYTTWCGPCKMMAAKIFPDEQVAEVYNDRFINAKFDMEKGEGPALAARFSVMAYPTYLFVNGAGELVHKGLGYIPKTAFLELADVAVSDQSMGALRARYDAGDRDPGFITSYVKLLVDGYERERAEEIVGDYLDAQEDWGTPENLQLLAGSPGQVGDKRLSYLIEHAADAEAIIGSGRLMNTLQQSLVDFYMRENEQRTLVPPADIADHYAKYAAPLKDRLLAHYSLMYFQRNGQLDDYLPAALAYYRSFPSDDFAELNSVAWTFFENSEDADELAQATEWAERSVELNAYYPNLDTLAWLYHKTGQQEKAEETARRAIAVAKESGADYSGTEPILERD